MKTYIRLHTACGCTRDVVVPRPPTYDYSVMMSRYGASYGGGITDQDPITTPVFTRRVFERKEYDPVHDLIHFYERLDP